MFEGLAWQPYTYMYHYMRICGCMQMVALFVCAFGNRMTIETLDTSSS